MKRKLVKVLYFIAGSAPTEAELEDADQFFSGKSTVAFRNARYVRKDEAIEEFDVVAGLVPDNYAKAALEKGETAMRGTPIVDAAKVPEGSPLAPKDGEGGEDGKAAPKKPEGKADAGWKPNA